MTDYLALVIIIASAIGVYAGVWAIYRYMKDKKLDETQGPPMRTPAERGEV